MNVDDDGGMRCSSDLRQRVVDFVRGGGSKAEAARRFRVGEASVYRWLKPGGLTYQRPGSRRAHKLDWEQLRRHVEDHPDRTQAERARHFHVSRHCIWNALQKMAITHKKSWATENATLSDDDGFSVFANGSCDAANSPSTSMNAGLRLRRCGGMDTHRKASA